MALAIGSATAFVGHAPPYPLASKYREDRYDGSQATKKFRYLKSLEHRDAREAARLAELDALREYHD